MERHSTDDRQIAAGVLRGVVPGDGDPGGGGYLIVGLVTVVLTMDSVSGQMTFSRSTVDLCGFYLSSNTN